MAAQGLELAPVTRQYEAGLTPVKGGDPRSPGSNSGSSI